MNDSTIDNRPGEGGLEGGPSADELFGAIEDESIEGESIDRGSGDGGAPKTIEDRTAADVFDEIRAETTPEPSASELLADESPEEIIASADEPPRRSTGVEDDLTVDDETLADLLLTGRTKGEEFLWVDTGDSGDDNDDNPDSSGDARTTGADDADDADGPTLDFGANNLTETGASSSSAVASSAGAASSAEDERAGPNLDTGAVDADASDDGPGPNDESKTVGSATDAPNSSGAASANGEDGSTSDVTEAIESWASPEADPIEVNDERVDSAPDGHFDDPSSHRESGSNAVSATGSDGSAGEESESDSDPIALGSSASESGTDDESDESNSTADDDGGMFRGGLVAEPDPHSGTDGESDASGETGTDTSDEPSDESTAGPGVDEDPRESGAATDRDDESSGERASTDRPSPTRGGGKSRPDSDDDESTGLRARLRSIPLIGRFV